MTVLKVLRREPDGTLWSMYPSPFEVKYAPLVRTYQHPKVPSNYGLTCLPLDEIDAAFRWSESNPNLEVWVCSAGAQMGLPPLRLPLNDYQVVAYDPNIPWNEQADYWWPSITVIVSSRSCPNDRPKQTLREQRPPRRPSQ